jgi:hypothetical protein
VIEGFATRRSGCAAAADLPALGVTNTVDAAALRAAGAGAVA